MKPGEESLQGPSLVPNVIARAAGPKQSHEGEEGLLRLCFRQFFVGLSFQTQARPGFLPEFVPKEWA